MGGNSGTVGATAPEPGSLALLATGSLALLVVAHGRPKNGAA
jgi:hypothetical protein